MENQNSTTSLLQLAPEIRNQIYEHLFPQGQRFTVTQKATYRNGLRRQRLELVEGRLDLSILRLNSQTNKEIWAILIKNLSGTFVVWNVVDFTKLPPLVMELTKALCYRDIPTYWTKQCDYALRFPNLERIIVGIYMEDVSLPLRDFTDKGSLAIEEPEKFATSIARTYGINADLKNFVLRYYGQLRPVQEAIDLFKPINLTALHRIPTIILTVRFAYRSTGIDDYCSGISANYDLTTGCVMEATPVYLVRERHHRGGEWRDPRNWMEFTIDQEEKLTKRLKNAREEAAARAKAHEEAAARAKAADRWYRHEFNIEIPEPKLPPRWNPI